VSIRATAKSTESGTWFPWVQIIDLIARARDAQVTRLATYHLARLDNDALKNLGYPTDAIQRLRARKDGRACWM
jgi:hypothetical protein